MSNNPKDEKERDEFIFDQIQKRFEREWQRLRDLDNKASSIIGFVSVATGVLLGTGMLGIINFDTVLLQAKAFFVFGTGLLILSIVLGLLGFKVRAWHDVPDVSHLIDEYKNKPYGKVLRRTAGEMKKVVLEMEIKLNQKARFIEASWYSLVVGIIFVFVFVTIMVDSVSTNSIEQVESTQIEDATSDEDWEGDEGLQTDDVLEFLFNIITK